MKKGAISKLKLRGIQFDSPKEPVDTTSPLGQPVSQKFWGAGRVRKRSDPRMDQRRPARGRKGGFEGEHLERAAELLCKGQNSTREISKIGGASHALRYVCLKTDYSLR